MCDIQPKADPGQFRHELRPIYSISNRINLRFITPPFANIDILPGIFYMAIGGTADNALLMRQHRYRLIEKPERSKHTVGKKPMVTNGTHTSTAMFDLPS